MLIRFGTATRLFLLLTLAAPAALAAQQSVAENRAIARGLVHEPRKGNVDVHAAIVAEDEYPSASKCASCHQAIYDEWSASSHAYASVSPVFHKFEQRINNLSSGTINYFCMRCHSSVGTTQKEQRDISMAQRSQVSREGITCVACHRVSESFGKVNGERRI